MANEISKEKLGGGNEINMLAHMLCFCNSKFSRKLKRR